MALCSGFKTVAVKELRDGALFWREFDALAAVQGCRWSIQLLGWFKKGGAYYIIMEVQ
jgi:hypothetical protein